MKRFRFQNEDDSFYIEAIDEDQAWSIFRKQWARYLASCADAGRSRDFPLPEEASMLEIGQEEHQYGPRPTCCEAVNSAPRFDYEEKGPTIVLRVHKYDRDQDRKLVYVRWAIRQIDLKITYCPHCGTKLPEVELKEKPPEPIYVPDDQEGHCLTCDSDSHGWCQCNPASAAYQIKETT